MRVPGDGRYEWQGFVDNDALPRASIGPSEGFFATTNPMNLSASDYPVTERKVGFEWSDPARWQRIVEVLRSKSKMTLADAMGIAERRHLDAAGAAAGRFAEAAVCPMTPTPKKGLELLQNWDARDSADSAAAAVTNLDIQSLGRRAAQGSGAQGGGPDRAGSLQHFAHRGLSGDSPDEKLGADPRAARDQILPREPGLRGRRSG